MQDWNWLTAGALLLTRRGYFTVAAMLLLGMLLLAPIAGIINTGRVTAEPIYFLLAPLIASVILRPRHIWLISAISVAAMIIVISVITENPLDTTRGQALIRNGLVTVGVAALVGTVSAYNTHTALRTADRARTDADRRRRSSVPRRTRLLSTSPACQWSIARLRRV